MAVRLFVGNLSYSTTEADLRTYFGAVAPPSQVVLPVDRETGRPRGIRVRRIHRSLPRRDGDSAIQRPDVQWTPAGGQRSARPRGPWPRRSGGGGFSGPPPGRLQQSRPAAWRIRRPGVQAGPAAVSAARGPAAASAVPRVRSTRRRPRRPRSRNFGPDAKPQKGPGSKAKKKDAERPRGPIPMKFTGRSFSLDDDSPDEAMPGDLDDFATSKPEDGADEGSEE